MDSQDYSPPMSVVKAWIKQCNCCPICNQQIPCDGVRAGGLCDDMCGCDSWDELDDPENTYD